MTYQAPGLITDGRPQEPDEARTQVLAKAFNEVSDQYFDRLADYEEAIEEAEEKQKKLRYLGAVGLVALLVSIGLFVIGSGFETGTFLDEVSNLRTVAGALGAVALIVLGYVLYVHRKATKKIRRNRREMENDEPDGSVSFVSQVNVPFYLVPYRDKHLIFDSLGVAPETDLELAKIDTARLEDEGEILDELKAIYDEDLSDETVVSPKVADGFSSNVAEHGKLELPITRQIDELTEVISDIEEKVFSVGVHSDNTPANSIRALTQASMLRRGNEHRTIETAVSMDECVETVNEIRGLGDASGDGSSTEVLEHDEDILDRVEGYRSRVREITEELLERLENSAREAENHAEFQASYIEDTTTKRVCAHCLKTEVNRIEKELELLDEILGHGSFGDVLSDEDLNEIEPGFTQEVRAEVHELLPRVEGKLKRAYSSLEELEPEKLETNELEEMEFENFDEEEEESGDIETENDVYTYVCSKHGEAETIEVPRTGSVFGATFENLYDELRESLTQLVDELEKESRNARDAKEEKMSKFAQYEAMIEELDHEYRTIKRERDVAERKAEKRGQDSEQNESGSQVSEEGSSRDRTGGV